METRILVWCLLPLFVATLEPQDACPSGCGEYVKDRLTTVSVNMDMLKADMSERMEAFKGENAGLKARSAVIEALWVELEERMKNLTRENEDLKERLTAMETSRSELQAKNRRLGKRISKLEDKDKSSKDALAFARTQSSKPTCRGIKYNEICFIAEVHTTYDITLSLAWEICANHSQTLGNIYSEKHYKELLKYIRTIMPIGIELVGLWTGMEANEAKRVTLSDGSTAPFLFWFPGRPLNDPDATRVNFRVNRDENDLAQGMYDHYPYWQDYGVLCEG